MVCWSQIPVDLKSIVLIYWFGFFLKNIFKVNYTYFFILENIDTKRNKFASNYKIKQNL